MIYVILENIRKSLQDLYVVVCLPNMLALAIVGGFSSWWPVVAVGAIGISLM